MKYFSIIGIAILVLLVLMYFYGKTTDGFENADSFTLYYAKWCPHCKDVKPVFENWSKSGSITVNGKSISLKIVEESENTDKTVPVKGFPTFLLKTSDGQYKEFNGDRSPAGWESWLKSNV